MVSVIPHQTIQQGARAIWRPGSAIPFPISHSAVAEETPIALTYDGSTHAVMMATPTDLEDFALGFSLSEGLISRPAEIVSLDIVAQPDGIELRMWLSAERSSTVARRRRLLAGPTGCGLCGLESLSEAARPLQSIPVGTASFFAEDIAKAISNLRFRQPIHRETGAMHAAGLWVPETGLIAVREDIGRHNALDKLAGATAAAAIATSNAAVLLTSRVSVELVQKSARMGVPLVVAVSAPTALAIRTAQQAGITLVAIARDDGFQIFTHAHRVSAARSKVQGEHFGSSFVLG